MGGGAESKAVGAEIASVLPDDNRPWYRRPHLLKLNLTLFCVLFFSSANGYDGSLMNGLQALPQWQESLQYPTGAWLGFINAVQSLGAFCLFPAVAWSNNRFGRKKSIAIGYFWLITGTTIQASAQVPAMFVVGRLCIGGASAFYSGSAPLLVTETAYPTHRGIITALYNCGWYVGSLLAAWVTFGTRNYAGSWAWRIPSLVQIAIPAASFVGFLFAPESPRWLASKGRLDEARSFLIKHHAGGDEASPLAAFELEEISATIRMENEIAKSTSWADLVRGKSNKHRTFITVTLGIFAQWNGVGIASYYLAPVLQSVGVTSVTDQTMISGFLQVWNLMLAVGAALCVDRFGRRKLFLTSTAGMLMSYIFITALSATFAKGGVAAIGVAVIPFLFLFYGFYDIAFTPLVVSYTCEIWPYTLRARGNALCQLATQLAIFFNVFVNPIALEAIHWKYYIVYIVMLTIIGATIWYFYPETKGHTLEEMARVFDGDNANVADEKQVREAVRAMSTDHGDMRKKDHVTNIENVA